MWIIKIVPDQGRDWYQKEDLEVRQVKVRFRRINRSENRQETNLECLENLPERFQILE